MLNIILTGLMKVNSLLYNIVTSKKNFSSIHATDKYKIKPVDYITRFLVLVVIKYLNIL